LVGLDLLVLRGTPATADAFINEIALRQSMEIAMYSKLLAIAEAGISDDGGHLRGLKAAQSKRSPAT
jgi:hypothetical protein